MRMLIILIAILSISSNRGVEAAPSSVKKIRTIQCFEDLRGSDSDFDFSEPCEEVIEYLIVDSSNNLYGIARTARTIQSGDSFSTVVYF